MQISKRDLYEILNGNQELISNYKEKYFPEEEHTYICEQCGKKFSTIIKVKRKYCSAKCSSDHFHQNQNKEYAREYKKMYARMMAGKISREELKVHMSEFKNKVLINDQ